MDSNLFSEKSPLVGGITATNKFCHTHFSPAFLTSWYEVSVTLVTKMISEFTGGVMARL